MKQLKVKAYEEIFAIAKTDETFLSLSIKLALSSCKKERGNLGKLVKLHKSLRFLDSYQFVSQSVQSLSKKLEANDFSIRNQLFSNIFYHLFVKFTKEGFYSYSYLDSFEKFKEPLLIFGESWKNSLTGAIHITPFDYQRALNVYQEFGCRNLGDNPTSS